MHFAIIEWFSDLACTLFSTDFSSKSHRQLWRPEFFFLFNKRTFLNLSNTRWLYLARNRTTVDFAWLAQNESDLAGRDESNVFSFIFFYSFLVVCFLLWAFFENIFIAILAYVSEGSVKLESLPCTVFLSEAIGTLWYRLSHVFKWWPFWISYFRNFGRRRYRRPTLYRARKQHYSRQLS